GERRSAGRRYTPTTSNRRSAGWASSSTPTPRISATGTALKSSGLGQESRIQQLRRPRRIPARVRHEIENGVADVLGLHPRDRQQIGAGEGADHIVFG